MDMIGVISGQRMPAAVVREQGAHFAAMPELCALLDAVPSVLMVLNRQRQIVFANHGLLNLLNLPNVEAAYGQRPGELFACEHAFETGGGCGTSEACTACGAARAIGLCERGAAAVQECRIIQQRTGKALSLRISTTPFHVNGTAYTVMGLTDISHEKRRQALERIFFHDLLNTAGGIKGYAQLLPQLPAGELPEISQSIQRLASTLVEEIRAQRALAAAESDDLSVQWESLRTLDVLHEVAEIYRNHDAARDRHLHIDAAAADITFTSDRQLLTRVLSNLAKNALEGSQPGGVATMGCAATGDEVEFTIHNAGAMPRQVQLQVFQRSFSTKGPGRGLGTYSIKLLTERYLKGRVSFTSTAEGGTIFRVRYPR